MRLSGHKRRNGFVEEAAKQGVAICPGAWIPWPIGLAHGLDLPAAFAVRVVGPATTSDLEPLATAVWVACFGAALWYFVVAGVQLVKLSESGG